MKTFSKKISAVLLSVYMVFGVVSTEYLEVQAFEWIVPQLSFSEALPFLLGVLGVFAEGEKLESGYYDYSGFEDDMDAYMIDWGIVADDLTTWKNNIVSGSLSQASSCWTAFKEWVVNKFTPSMGGDIPYNSFISACPMNISTFTYSGDTWGKSLPMNFDSSKTFAYIQQNSNGSFTGTIYFDFDAASISTTGGLLNYSLTYPSTIGSYWYYLQVNSSTQTISWGRTTTNQSKVYTGTLNLRYADRTFAIFPFSDSLVDSASASTVLPWNASSSGDTTVNNIYNITIVPGIDLAPSDSREAAIPDVMPLPWDNVGDTDDEAKDKIAGVIDGVNTGELSLADAMQKILDWLNALAVDTTADDTLVPENPDKPDETFPDRVQENQDNFGFTLAGFEKLFPFCIPFDIYAFMTLLVAEPVAPVIEYPVYNPVTNQNEIIKIDFSTWESVVHLFRYIFDFLFIIGLLLAARSLIGGGDKS